MIKRQKGDFALVAVTSMVCLLQGGCGSAQNDESSARAGAAPANLTTPKQKQIVIGMPWEPIGLYPIRAIDSASYYAQTLLYEGLVKYDPQLKIVPALADQFTIGDGGCTYRFRLRRGLHFSDGSPITLNDVEATYRLALSVRSPFRADYADIASIECLGENEFVLHLKQPNAALLSRLVELRILPAKLLRAPDGGLSSLSRTPIASGPFCLKRWESGLELDFVPNSFYWGTKPKTDSLIWRVVPDKALLALCLSRGELDAAQIDAQTWTTVLSRQRELQLDRFPGSRTMYLGFNLTEPPLDQLPVRQAICSGIDRQSIITNIYHGFAFAPASDVPKGSWVYNRQAMILPFDRIRAQNLLKEVEEHTPFKQVSFRILTVRDSQDVAEAVSDDLKRIGIKNEVQVLEYSTLRRSYLQKGKFSSVIWSRSSGPDPECGIVWGSGGPLNYCRYKDAKVDELLAQGRHAMNREERAKAYAQIQMILATELPWIFLAQPEFLLAHSNHCHGLTQAGQEQTGLPWDNPLFNAPYWEKDGSP
jgi:peptide/nickel transport system substrate-binding protein